MSKVTIERVWTEGDGTFVRGWDKPRVNMFNSVNEWVEAQNSLFNRGCIVYFRVIDENTEDL